MIWGQDRNDANVVAHAYEGTDQKPGRPLCARGWNRGDGRAYSIFRGKIGKRGKCKVCERRAAEDKPGVDPKPRRTKWI